MATAGGGVRKQSLGCWRATKLRSWMGRDAGSGVERGRPQPLRPWFPSTPIASDGNVRGNVRSKSRFRVAVAAAVVPLTRTALGVAKEKYRDPKGKRGLEEGFRMAADAITDRSLVNGGFAYFACG
ncbi:hypothetical protein Hte_010911 [Hypoxylon texense]